MRSFIDLVEAPNRYHGVIEPGSRRRWGASFDITKPMVAYHATHEAAGLVLTDRVAKTYDSMGTWLTSNAEMAGEMYGPRVASYQVPLGHYLLAKRRQDMHELILNCLPMIERNVHPDVADHIANYPLSAENRAWTKDIRTQAKALAAKWAADWGDSKYEDVQQATYDILSKIPGGMKRWRSLEATHNMYRKVAVSAGYSKQFKEFMISCGYTGFIWNNRSWDNSPQKQTIFLIFKHEDLQPIENFERLNKKKVAGDYRLKSVGTTDPEQKAA
jgi:hypothetical protein